VTCRSRIRELSRYPLLRQLSHVHTAFTSKIEYGRLRGVLYGVLTYGQ
jgi:hypothetical protein